MRLHLDYSSSAKRHRRQHQAFLFVLFLGKLPPKARGPVVVEDGQRFVKMATMCLDVRGLRRTGRSSVTCTTKVAARGRSRFGTSLPTQFTTNHSGSPRGGRNLPERRQWTIKPASQLDTHSRCRSTYCREPVVAVPDGVLRLCVTLQMSQVQFQLSSHMAFNPCCVSALICKVDKCHLSQPTRPPLWGFVRLSSRCCRSNRAKGFRCLCFLPP